MNVLKLNVFIFTLLFAFNFNVFAEDASNSKTADDSSNSAQSALSSLLDEELNNRDTIAVYEVKSDTSLYQLALQAGISVKQILELNPQAAGSETNLKVGDSIKLPAGAIAKLSGQSALLDTNDTSKGITTLPALGDVKQASPQNQNLIGLPGTQYFTGSTEENTAHLLTDAATQDWNNMNAKALENRGKSIIKNRISSEVNQKANEFGSDFLGRFGKASVNISIDEKGKLQGSSVNLLTPLLDEKTHLIFSQVGIHGQGYGNESRTIGNFGIGYRYDAEDWLLGTNLFIDQDFTGNNTRLGLGGEWWIDYAKVAANTYMPISDWKTSEVMKHYEALIYDERPARGFDIRTQAYLPSYPQIGGSLVYEHYFGDEVALFRAQDRLKDPYAFTLGLDYTPVPILTAKAAHRMGKNSQHDSRLDLNFNLQLGTPLEAQLNPDNVRLTRTLRGSRYDMVDRNYDIVFEYRQENFSVEITGPSEAYLNEPVDIVSMVQSRSPISEYKWVITDQTGTIRQEYISGAAFNFTPTQLRPYFVRLIITTERGAVGESNILRIDVKTQATSEFMFTPQTTPEAYVLENVSIIDELMIQSLGDAFTIKMDFLAKNSDGSAAELPDFPMLMWRAAGDSSFNPFDVNALALGLRQIVTQDSDIPNLYHFTVVADSQLLLDGESRLIQFMVTSSTHPDVMSPNYLEGLFLKSVSTQFVDPNNIIVEIHQITNTDLTRALVREPVSISGRINGKNVILENPKPIAPSRFYEVQIKRVDPSTQETEDVTDYFEESLIWLYWDPAYAKEVSAEIDNKQSLESCMGYPIYSTQVTNYNNNELAFGEIKVLHAADVVNEQGLRLAVKFDFSSVGDPSKVKTGRDRVCYPSSSTQADDDYLGYVVVNGETLPKAVEWIR